MPERDWTLFLKDIRTHAKKIRLYTKDLSMQEFFKDDKTYDAVMRNIQIIGEAIKHLPAEVRKEYKNVDWKKAAGLRDIVVHEYFGINKEATMSQKYIIFRTNGLLFCGTNLDDPTDT